MPRGGEKLFFLWAYCVECGKVWGGPLPPAFSVGAFMLHDTVVGSWMDNDHCHYSPSVPTPGVVYDAARLHTLSDE